jgi:flavin-dependent dehydrogenase
MVAGMGAGFAAQGRLAMIPGRIVIVGGGTAGWLAALVLGDAARRAGSDARITVIDSSKIGTIGVGEGTTAVFRMMLRQFGFDEAEFLRASGATIKFGIRHRDWRALGHSYDGPIDDPHGLAGLGDAALDLYQLSRGESVGQTHLFQHLMARNRSPFALQGDRLVPVGPYHHAYHFDQALAGKWLRSKARGVEVIDDQVAKVERNPETGDITSLGMESGLQVAGDFFVDCTGFRRGLIGTLGATWHSYGASLPVNRALPFWLDIPPGEEIAPVTLAWAQGNGWMWKIPTQGRYGCGYVFSDAHITPDQAKAELEAKLGHTIEVRNDIRIDAGRLSEQWRHNCVALGLASSFLEPLEATSIHGTVVQLMLLASVLGNPDARARAAFNATCARQVDDFRDFIRLHYVSQRRDTPFWQDLATSLAPDLQDKLALWQTRLPEPADFTVLPMGLPHSGPHLHIPVLDGLGLLSAPAAKAHLAARPALRAKARKAAQSLIQEYKLAAGRALGHRAYLAHSQTEPIQ